MRLVRRAVLVATAAWVIGLGGGFVSADRPLAEGVRIRRDTFGIPHILAETDEAAAFGLGYAQAEDHLETLARRYVRARGEAARIFGESETDNDLAMGRMDNYAEARRHLPSLGGRFRRVIQAFAAGINQHVSQHRATVPSWVPEFSEADILAYSRASAVDGVDAPARQRALAAKYPAEPASPPAPTLPDARFPEVVEAPDEPGSNALAIRGTRTTSGRPILLGNPHLRWSSLYWEAHITVPGRINFYGSTLVGIPWLRAGFSDRLGYVQTNNAPDLEDVLSLTLDPQQPEHYIFEGRSLPLVRRDVAVRVKQADGTMKTVTRTYWSSHLGPIVHRAPGKVFALQSVTLEAWRPFEGFYELTQARDLRDFLKRLGRGFNPTSNYTYADAEGNVLYLWNARLPRRPDDGTSYELDVPGSKRHVWTKYHAIGELPQLLNPPGGYIQNANNPPWFVSLRDPIDPRRFPAYVERGELGLRPQLALQMLESRDRFSADDVRELKFTTRMLVADRVKPALLSAARAVSAPSADLQRGIELLDAWDNRVSATSVGAVVFQRWWDLYRAAVKQPFAAAWDAAAPGTTPGGLSDPAVAPALLESAVQWTRQTFRSDAIAWGDAFRYRFGDIDLPGEGAAGLYGVYRVQQFDPMPDGSRVAGWGAEGGELAGFGDAWVLLVHFTRPVGAQSVLAYGQTTDRASSHSRDQIRFFAGRQLRPVWFSETEIRAHLEREYRP